MAERTLISWNVPNWITVMLMASAGYAILVGLRQVTARWHPRALRQDTAPPSGPVIAPDPSQE